MVKKLSHIGIAVAELEKSSQLISKLFQIKEITREVVEDQRVRTALYNVGGTSLELTEATGPDSPIAKFIQKRGEGVHHLSFEVDDLRAEIARLQSEGFQLIDNEPRRGAGGHWVAFVHPKSTNGILIELSQRKEE